LSEDEKNSGVLLVDIGGGTTDSLIFHGGSLKHTHVIAVGGDHATNDISVALRIPISAAEDVKKNYGCALEDRVAPNEEFELSSIAGRAVTRYSRRELAHIIELRMRELFSHVRQQLDRTGLGNLLGGGVVLTGGGAVMDGTVELAERIFKLPVRLGKPTGFSGLTEVLESPIYATGTGLTQYGYRFRKEGRVSRFRGRGFFSKVLDRMRSWFRKGGA
jgi:cell division protein FtsA